MSFSQLQLCIVSLPSLLTVGNLLGDNKINSKFNVMRVFQTYSYALRCTEPCARSMPRVIICLEQSANKYFEFKKLVGRQRP